MDPAKRVVAAVEGLWRRLARLGDLRPGPEVDRLFRALVELALHTPGPAASAALADPTVQALRPRLVELSARAEYQLELAWAERIVASATPRAELRQFPYVDNYELLCDIECAAVQAHALRPVRRMLFVGSGPLPLSSVFMAERLGAQADSLDHDPRAVRVARRVAGTLVTGGRTPTFIGRDLLASHDLAAYDLVVVAALVGLSAADKQCYLAHLARSMSPGALVLARSAHLLRTLLYPAVDLGAAQTADGLELVAVVHPEPPVVNSLVVARVTAGV